MEDGSQFVAGILRSTFLGDVLEIDIQLFFQDIDLSVDVEGGICGLPIEVVAYLLEDPGATEGGSADHHSIYAIAFECLSGLLGRGDVAIANDWDGDAGIVFHLSYQCPVGLAGIHL